MSMNGIALDYDDIQLVPTKISTLLHRSEADTSVFAFGTTLSIPIVSSPMMDVCNGEMAHKLNALGAYGLIHRFQSIEEQVNEYNWKQHENNYAGCAIGVTGDYYDRFAALYNVGCRTFCLDTANGANIQVGQAVKTLRAFDGQSIYIIAGNVASGIGFAYLADIGVDAVRVGIGNGSVCITRTETGIYHPTINALVECVETRNSKEKFAGVKIIADGGIKTPADMCKALAVGADLVMCGGILAGTDESPGKVLKVDGKKVKLYRGAASWSVQQESGKDEILYNEGEETLVPYKGSVAKIIHRFQAGLQSSMSYLDARTLGEYRNNAHFVFIQR